MTSASNYGVIYNISGSSTAGGTNDYAIAASESFNVAVGNVLVVEFDQCAQFNNALEANPTIKWVTSAGTQSLGAPLIEQTGAGSAFPYAEIYYLPTPNTGAGNLVISASGRTATISALTLSGVNTNIAPLVISASSNTTTGSMTLSSAILRLLCRCRGSRPRKREQRLCDRHYGLGRGMLRNR